MIKKTLISLIILSASLLFPQERLVNTAHLDHLYEEKIVNNDTLGIIHIYSEYPDYKWVDDGDEGSACVDDAARAMIFYLYDYQLTKENASLRKTQHILNFLFYMQADNGFFYNFVWKDNSINKEFRTSVAEPNWWSWRALWALAEANKFFKNANPGLAIRITDHLKRLITAAIPVLAQNENYGEFSGLKLPLWLPYETASDQAAILLKGLTIYYETEKDSAVLNLIHKLADGIMKMQAGDKDTPPYFAFLSWQNTWHAWGNSQADALLNAGTVLNDTAMVNAALDEIKYFYPFLTWKKYFSDFSIEKNEGEISFKNKNTFPQIAYGFRPMIFASLSAYDHTGDPYYAELAGTIASWFFGKNKTSTQMYYPETGVCYDGLMEDKVNQNSGAESTIEALLSLIKIENNSVAKSMLNEETDSNNENIK